MTLRESTLLRRHPIRISADTSRVVTRLFVPGLEGFDQQESRSNPVLQRVLELSDLEVKEALDDVLDRFSSRHHGLTDTFRQHADELSDRLSPERRLSPARRLLLGATFTSEYAIEGAALCNPSMVIHPDQAGLSAGDIRFVMSVRAVGEGHTSSIGFRTGTVTSSAEVEFDAPPTFATTGQREEATLEAEVFKAELRRLRASVDDVDYVLCRLGPQFTLAGLEVQLNRLEKQGATRKQARRTIGQIRRIAERSYAVTFGSDTPLSERVLLPAMSAEAKGVEDARFVRFCDDDGSVTYYASYTAYNGTDIGQQLLETKDFVQFTSRPMAGAAAANKGLALFPRRISGRFAALSRSDRESNTITYSSNTHLWERSLACQTPQHSWEVVQLGNCGSPIETALGWLVLTHGVGPMRTYNIGAILLDLEDPTRVIGRLREPLLSPARDEQNGYVPNVLYSCGALVHADTLILPYGIGDSAIGVGSVPLGKLLGALLANSD